ncbi:bifunctional methionine sulfoxide reductase B/A protein [Candidatus Berkiella cookevillensis]|uniref:Peptide methionine sulfoxide reductase MsrA n=1 Tax=Candidatus Berkiella cookevillensis TaxID=437022 RepID=A0A0Q9YQJ0_9GAMM|nr:bifunctional methionine sulfoxide reductase B/A protein [Candidatus Berkiella cookevillensis]MCS5708086.1 bifunctional methionine sulfoxide reductase B/A protein [Candidatus Berkiella cookevillensis]
MKASYLDKLQSLTLVQRQIICDKATEYPHTGEYNKAVTQGTYLCRRCGLALFRAINQFHSGCGWPSFDENVVDAVIQKPDSDGDRIEILCSRCEAHLGHVFKGEHFTIKNLRHCVNSASLDFVANSDVIDSEEAIVAGGCFWGVEYFLKRLTGVLKVEVGYSGGFIGSPSYRQVCQGETGHYEAVRILFDKDKIDYKSIIKHFFEIHDPTQTNGQGPDLGQQYRSVVFYYDDAQKKVVEQLIELLRQKGFNVSTLVKPVSPFWPAEDYHQAYYDKHQKLPYCHFLKKRFD